MADRPLLLFPKPQFASRSNLGGGSAKIHYPEHNEQVTRLSSKFDELEKSFDARRIEIQQTADGIDPDQVIVIEIIGNVENFINAIKLIEGLEWLWEIEDEIIPDQDFFYNEKPEKNLNGRLYFIMSNQKALKDLLFLWREYQKNPNMKFERGYAKFGEVFKRLKDIRRWDTQDRFLDTGIIEAWSEDLEYDGERLIKFEIELWFRKSNQKREIAEADIKGFLEELGGEALRQIVIEAIGYHGILAKLPASKIRDILNNRSTKLVKCDSIMFFRPVGQMSIGEYPIEGIPSDIIEDHAPLPNGNPIIALLDGLPLANHELLKDRIIIDDPETFEANYPASERIHGTCMASLIIHGDLSENLSPLSRPIYVRPIMQPAQEAFTSPRPEETPSDILIIDLIHRAVKRIFEGDEKSEAVAPQIKIINLSIGDSTRQFLHFISPLARLIDWLSNKYNVLFIISAGNHSTTIPLNISYEDFAFLSPKEIQEKAVKFLYLDARNRKILSPAESINSLTIGSIHHDSSQTYKRPDCIDPYEDVLPSPFSAFGSGHRRSIKPDLVFTGGKQWYKKPYLLNQPVRLEGQKNLESSPGVKTAYPGKSGGLNNTAFTRGTSNATALISRAAGLCYESLQQIFYERILEAEMYLFEIPLLKAMLIHGCSWKDIGNKLSEILRTPENDHQLGSLVNRWLGYGVPEIDRVLNCTERRATLIGFGQLKDEEAHLFSLPLPSALESRPEWRRLTITLAWISPIIPTTQRYRSANLWFEIDGVNLTEQRMGASAKYNNWRAVRRGTVQHEIFEGTRAEPFTAGNNIKIKVNCRKDAGKFLQPIAYGIIVSLEVAEGVNISIYDEIRTLIIPLVEVQANKTSI